jgi:hypothetical protein
MNILEQAILEANQVKEIAYANASQAIKEAFQPKIQRMIASRLAEEGDEEDEFADDNPAMAAPVAPAADPMADPAMAAPVAPVPTAPAVDPAMAAPVAPAADPAAEAPFEDDDDMTEEYDALVAELSMEDELSTDPLEGEEEINLESILDDNIVLEIDEFEDDANSDLFTGVPQAPTMQAENTRLRKELSDTRRANVVLKTAMNEVNLLNAKLMYASKAAHNFELSESQQVKLLKTFDSAKTIREVKLVYSALVESYQLKGKVTSKNSTAKLTESLIPASASRTVNTVARQAPNKGELPFANRWKELANIKKIQH